MVTEILTQEQIDLLQKRFIAIRDFKAYFENLRVGERLVSKDGFNFLVIKQEELTAFKTGIVLKDDDGQNIGYQDAHGPRALLRDKHGNLIGAKTTTKMIVSKYSDDGSTHLETREYTVTLENPKQLYDFVAANEPRVG